MIIVILALLFDYLSQYRDIVRGAEEKRAHNSIITPGGSPRLILFLWKFDISAVSQANDILIRVQPLRGRVYTCARDRASIRSYRLKDFYKAPFYFFVSIVSSLFRSTRSLRYDQYFERFFCRLKRILSGVLSSKFLINSFHINREIEARPKSALICESFHFLTISTFFPKVLFSLNESNIEFKNGHKSIPKL